jgi:hypothetical protein
VGVRPRARTTKVADGSHLFREHSRGRMTGVSFAVGQPPADTGTTQQEHSFPVEAFGRPSRVEDAMSQPGWGVLARLGAEFFDECREVGRESLGLLPMEQVSGSAIAVKGAAPQPMWTQWVPIRASVGHQEAPGAYVDLGLSRGPGSPRLLEGLQPCRDRRSHRRGTRTLGGAWHPGRGSSLRDIPSRSPP